MNTRSRAALAGGVAVIITATLLWAAAHAAALFGSAPVTAGTPLHLGVTSTTPSQCVAAAMRWAVAPELCEDSDAALVVLSWTRAPRFTRVPVQTARNAHWPAGCVWALGDTTLVVCPDGSTYVS